MRIVYILLATISVILALILSILPFGSLAFIPIILGCIFSFLALKQLKKEGKNTNFIKVLFLGIIISLVASIYRTVFTENTVIETEQAIEREQESEDEALKELENIEIED